MSDYELQLAFWSMVAFASAVIIVLSLWLEDQ